MGDMGEIFRAMKEHNKERREARLAAANPEGWTQHTPYHWSRTIGGKRINYWPSNGLVMIGQKRHNINSKHIRALLASQEQGQL